jgi:DNA gyrase/topoisomerase IV subunit A
MNLTSFMTDDNTEALSITSEKTKEVKMTEKNSGYSLSQLAANEWKDFALYTVESRAIPNMVDGMKPVQRFYLYSSIQNSKKEFKKVSAIAGVLSSYGYNHGETSGSGAGQLMASEWSNNICLVEGRGSFGTRLVQEAAAPRYTYTRLHKNFDRFIRDVDLAPEHTDPEHEPPAFYVPVIPLVLVNGVRGIATGFATNILPRDPKDLARACKEYIETGTVGKKIAIKFPDFSGKVSYDVVKGRYDCVGRYELKSKTVLLITEVPYGFDRETYVQVLDKLEEDGPIVSYEDQCDKNGFRFEIKLKQSVAADLTDAKIVQMFKLSKPFAENLTVIDFNGKLREYEDERQLVKDFCEFRNTVLDKRIMKRKQEFNEEVRWLTVKMQFIQAVIDNQIKFKNQKKDAVCSQILTETSALETDCDRLLRINLMNLTSEMVKQLKDEIEVAKKELKFWQKTTVKEQFLCDLEELFA